MERSRGLDLPGLVLLGAAISLLTVPLVLGQEEGWPLWSWLSLGAAVVFSPFSVCTSPGSPGGVERRWFRARVLRHPGMGLAVFRLLAVMAVNAGFLFALTLHVQGGLGYSALRAGLTFAPTAVVFGLVGLTWRDWPAALQGVLIPVGFAVAAVAVACVGAVLKGGGDGGFWLYVGARGHRVGLALGFSPTLTRALATVRPEDAADAERPARDGRAARSADRRRGFRHTLLEPT